MKKVLIIGATGLIGKSIVEQMKDSYELVCSSFNHSTYPADISDRKSLKALFDKVGEVDGIICVGGMVRFASWQDANDDDWQHGFMNKLFGQVNVIRYGAQFVKAKGAIVLTTGALAQYPIPGSAIVTTVNAAVEAAISSAALELTEDIRVNAVSPGWVKESMEAMGMDSSAGMPVALVAKCFIEQLSMGESGSVKSV